MRGFFPLYLGVRNLFGRGGRPSPYLLGSVLGIALSLVPLIVVMEVADGMIEGITRRFLEVGTYHAQVSLPGSGAELSGLVAAIRALPEVRYAMVERQGLGLAAAAGFPAAAGAEEAPAEPRRTAVTIRAVPPGVYTQDAGFRRYFTMEKGRFDLASPDSILLGKEVAQRLGVGEGDRVRLLTLRGGARSLPIISSFTVKGIFSTGYQELDKLWVYIPLAASVRLLGGRGSTQFIGVKFDDPFSGLQGKLDRLRAVLPGDAQVTGWYDLEKANYKSFQTTRALLLFIMALIVAVAAVNVSSALVMVVLERTGEIAMLKAMGASPSHIRLAFTLTALATGLAGTALGLAGGMLVAVNINPVLAGLETAINAVLRLAVAALAPVVRLPAPPVLRLFNAEFYLERIPIDLRLPELAAIAAGTMLLATLAAWLPARRAGGIRPLDVLRRA
jgi:lipoprotein-releasing system permease protein